MPPYAVVGLVVSGLSGRRGEWMQRSGNNASDGGRAPRTTSSDRPAADGASGGAARTSGTQSVPPSTIDRLTVGTVVNGKYRVLSILGRGSMGIVAECEHVELRERLALKFLLTRGNVVGEDFRVRFMREAQVSAKLKGLHIARVVDVGVWLDAIPFMVMEHLEGTDLARVLRAGGRLPLDVALDYAIQICEGMAEAHALGVVHRDLKPSNVFVTHQADGTDLIKILDFGVSKWDLPDRDGEGTQAGLILGSPKYMAPEQMLTASKVDARADVWSIGALVYQMMIGRSPFDFPTFAQTFAEVVSNRPPPPMAAQVPEIPASLEGAVMRCFERTPEARYQSVAELAGALLDAVDSPFSAGTRARIESVLATRGGRDTSGMEQLVADPHRFARHGAGQRARPRRDRGFDGHGRRRPAASPANEPCSHRRGRAGCLRDRLREPGDAGGPARRPEAGAARGARPGGVAGGAGAGRQRTTVDR